MREDASKTDDENPYFSAQELIDEDTKEPRTEQGIDSDDLPDDITILQCGTVLKEGEGIIGRTDPDDASLDDLNLDQ